MCKETQETCGTESIIVIIITIIYTNTTRNKKKENVKLISYNLV